MKERGEELPPDRLALRGHTRHVTLPVVEERSLTAQLRSEADSGQERFARVRRSFSLGLFARAVSLVTSFLLVRVALGQLGAAGYGLWMTVTAAGSFLGVGDLGLGLGALTLVADAFGADDREAARRLSSSAFCALAGVAALLGVAFLLVAPGIDWAAVLGAPAAMRGEAAAAVVAFTACFLLGLPLGMVDQLRAAHQEAPQNSLAAAAGAALGLLGAWICARCASPLWVLVLVTSGAALVTRVINGVALFRQRPWLLPRWLHVDAATGRALLRMGSVFFVLQVGGLLSYQSDSLILAWRLGPTPVAEYAVVTKLFLVLPNLAGLALMPLWPAYREALVRHDGAWIRTAFRRSLWMSGGGGALAAALLALVAAPVIAFWTGGAVHPGGLLILCAAAWAGLNCIYGPLAMLSNGAHGERFQAALIIPATLLNIAVSWWATGRVGPAGVLLGSLAATVLLGLIPLAFWARGALQALEPEPVAEPQRVSC